MLRKQGLIEGRYPNVHVTSTVAKVTHTESDYLNNKGLNDFHYQELILNYLENYPRSKKKEIFVYLKEKLPGILDEKQKLRKTEYILTKLSKAEKIRSEGNSNKTFWIKN